MRSSSEDASARRRAEVLAQHAAVASGLPLYRLSGGTGEPDVHSVDRLHAVGSELGDPFGGRRDPAHPSTVLVQMARDLPLYWSFDDEDLRSMAEMTADVWRRLGVSERSRIAFYDYATSPTVLFASRSFVSYLEEGAADMLGCLPICNDGLPELADRCVHVLEYMQPDVLFVDNGVMEPLIRALADRPTVRRPARVIAAGDEDPADPGRISAWGSSLGCEVSPMLRIDAALLLAPPCDVDPTVFHPDPSRYVVEAVGDTATVGQPGTSGRVVVTNLALRSTVVHRYASALSGWVSDGTCECGWTGTRLVIDHG